MGGELKSNTVGNILDPLLNNQPTTERTMRNEVNQINKNAKVNKSMDNSEPIQGNRARGISEGSRNSSVASNRSCSHYVPEKV